MRKAKWCVSAFGVVLTLAASTPTPTSAADWIVNGTTLTGTEALATTAAVDEASTLKFAGVTVVCEGTTLNAASPKIEATSKGSSSSLEFSHCKADSPCTISSESIATNPVTLEATTEGTLAVVATFKPTTGTVFADLDFSGSECSLEGIWSITGQAKVLAPTGQDEHTIQLVNSITTEGSRELRVEGVGASLSGSALLKLANSKPWSLASPKEKEGPGGGWMVGGKNLSGSKALATTARVDEEIVAKAAAATIECNGETLNAVAPELQVPNKGSAESIEFTGCSLVEGGACSIASTQRTAPVVVEATLEGPLAMVATFKPRTGTQFASVTFEGTECAEAGDILPIYGQAKILAPTGQDERTFQLITAIVKESSKELLVGTAAASLRGSVLRGTAHGERWSLL